MVGFHPQPNKRLEVGLKFDLQKGLLPIETHQTSSNSSKPPKTEAAEYAKSAFIEALTPPISDPKAEALTCKAAASAGKKSGKAATAKRATLL